MSVYNWSIWYDKSVWLQVCFWYTTNFILLLIHTCWLWFNFINFNFIMWLLANQIYCHKSMTWPCDIPDPHTQWGTLGCLWSDINLTTVSLVSKPTLCPKPYSACHQVTTTAFGVNKHTFHKLPYIFQRADIILKSLDRILLGHGMGNPQVYFLIPLPVPMNTVPTQGCSVYCGFPQVLTQLSIFII